MTDKERIEYLENDLKDLLDVLSGFPGRGAKGRYKPKDLDAWFSRNSGMVAMIRGQLGYTSYVNSESE